MSAAPPVIRHASNLMRDIELAVVRFPRRHRYVTGQDLRAHATKVAQLAIRAWRRPEKRIEIVDSLVDAVDDMKLSMQLAKELHAFASFRQFEDLARKASELGREVGDWTPCGPATAATCDTPTAGACASASTATSPGSPL